MCISGIERYKYTHKRAPRSSRAIHCTQASRKQVSIHNVLRQECESFFYNASLAFSYIHGPNMPHITPEVRYSPGASRDLYRMSRTKGLTI